MNIETEYNGKNKNKKKKHYLGNVWHNLSNIKFITYGSKESIIMNLDRKEAIELRDGLNENIKKFDEDREEYQIE